MTKQCKALELCDEYENKAHYDGDLDFLTGFTQLREAIQDLITEHEAELAKAAGTWISVSDELPDVGTPVPVSCAETDDFEIDYVDCCAHTGDEWFANDPDRMITHWFRLPAPPIVQPEPEIEVPDLHPADESYEAANEAHKAAMRPLLKRIRDLEEGRA